MIHSQAPQATPPSYEPVEPLRAATPFRLDVRHPVNVSEPVEETRYYDVVRISFESSGRNGQAGNQVEAVYFRSKSPGPKKLVVVLPIWGTSTYPPNKISRGYAKRSKGKANVIWVQGDDGLFQWDRLSSAATEERFMAESRESAERFRAAVVDMRRLVDWAEQADEIDGSRIAFVGFSMSALVTATLLGNEPRIKAAVLMLGGAQFADIFAYCGDKAGEVRRHAMTSFGWSLERYRDFFAQLFAPADPVRFRGRYDPSKLLMIDAKRDECIPPEAKNTLWQVTGRPERITLFYGHRHAFYSLTPLGFNITRRKIFRFLDRVL